MVLTAPQSSTIASLKAEALTALTAPVLHNPIPPSELDETLMDVDHPDSEEWKIPEVTHLSDFELCRALREKGRPTGRYDIMDDNATIKELLVNWEHVFVRFRDENGKSFRLSWSRCKEIPSLSGLHLNIHPLQYIPHNLPSPNILSPTSMNFSAGR